MVVPHLIATEDREIIGGVEDLRARKGFRAFYFRHTPNLSPLKLTRDRLWPLFGDVFRNGITKCLLPNNPGIVIQGGERGALLVPTRLNLSIPVIALLQIASPIWRVWDIVDLVGQVRVITMNCFGA
jgi:hypothetical protein